MCVNLKGLIEFWSATDQHNQQGLIDQWHNHLLLSVCHDLIISIINTLWWHWKVLIFWQDYLSTNIQNTSHYQTRIDYRSASTMSYQPTLGSVIVWNANESFLLHLLLLMLKMSSFFLVRQGKLEELTFLDLLIQSWNESICKLLEVFLCKPYRYRP